MSDPIAGMSEYCVISRCNTLYDRTSVFVNDDVDDVSPSTVVPVCGFRLDIHSEVSIVISGVGDDGGITMYGTCTVLEHSGYDTEPEIICDRGSALILDDRLVLNPEFDWTAYQYEDMELEIREQREPLSADLLILMTGCVIIAAVIVVSAISLRRL